MAPTSLLADENDIAGTLRQDHRHICTELNLAMTEPGPIGEAARLLAQLCLPHFELEERVVFPILARLRNLVTGDGGHPTLTDLQAQLVKLSREEKRFEPDHQAIVSAAEVFLEAAYKGGNQDLTRLGHMLTNHERIEDEVGLAAYELGTLGKSSS